MKPAFVVLPAIAFAALSTFPLQAEPPQVVFENQSPESIQITRDPANGMLTTRKVEINYHDIHLFYPDRHVVARDTVTREYSEATEGGTSKAKVEFFNADAKGNFPKTASQVVEIPEASEIRFLGDHWSATTYGCCDAEPYTRLYAFGSSKPFLRFNSGYAMVEVPNARENRYVGVALRPQVPTDAADEAIFGTNKKAHVAIAYASVGKPLQQLLLQPKAGIPEEKVPYHTLSVKLKSASPRDTPGWQEEKKDPEVLTMWSADTEPLKNEKFQGIKGLTIIAELDSPDGSTSETITIPVDNDKFGTPVINSKTLEVSPAAK